ncbi:MAG: metallophosphatase family protein [Deltaproteobacteria bacterium]|nr:metallophosphatase family protein [Deltaproteobacteria bacterium]
MRVAIIADIHGNLVALEAVLADIKKRGVDKIVCLGDVATIGPQPRETIARLRDIGCRCVMGNHESWMLDPSLLDGLEGAPDWFVNLIRWSTQQLTRDDLEYLGRFQSTIDIPVDMGKSIFCFHGSPRSNEHSIYPATPPGELNKMLAGHRSLFMAGAHTHAQMLRQHEGILIINPGSVGIPFEQRLPNKPLRFLPWAEYAIVHSGDGTVNVDLRRIGPDLAQVLNAPMDPTYPAREIWRKNWKGY